MASTMACGEPSAAGATCTSAAAKQALNVVEHADQAHAPAQAQGLDPLRDGRRRGRFAGQPQPGSDLLPGHDRPGSQELFPAAARCQPTRRDHQRRVCAASCSAEFDSASRSRASACVCCVRGGDSGTPRGTSKIRSRGYPAASNSRRAAGLSATKACARRQALLMPRPPETLDLAETIAMPAGPLRHEHHRNLRSAACTGPAPRPGPRASGPRRRPDRTGRRAAASNGPARGSSATCSNVRPAAGRDARRGCHDKQISAGQCACQRAVTIVTSTPRIRQAAGQLPRAGFQASRPTRGQNRCVPTYDSPA